MPEETTREGGVEVKVNAAIVGWLLAIVSILIMYTMFVYDKGVAKGMLLAQKTFYIEHYHSGEDGYYGINQGVNSLEDQQIEKRKAVPVQKPVRKKAAG